ncbi:hypothetical protein PVK06_047132 [Gossypium arboreum]|uniref:Uncharacterized protein n=1 Tax=Gossypium arboreum TaxID=29729 RepID=A0ABR0MCH3_GOSAR|nr:hypothetical protein PVK06_047132 [Gossypium arboreum]
MVERKIDILIEAIISQGDANLILDETLVNKTLNFDANISVSPENNPEFVINIVEPKAHDNKNNKKEKGKAHVSLKPSQKRKKGEKSSSEENYDLFDELYNSSDSSSSLDESFKENVPLKEIVSTTTKSNKLVITKLSIRRSKKPRKGGVLAMFADTVAKEKVEEEVFLPKRDLVFLAQNCLNRYMTLRTKGFIEVLNIEGISFVE